MKKSRAPCHATPMTTHSQKPLRYRCKICNHTYTARRGEISFGSKLSAQKILTLLTLLKRGTSIRRTAELLHLSPSTIERWKQKFLTQKLLSNSFTPNGYEHV